MSIVYHGDIRNDPNADYLNRVAVGDKFNSNIRIIQIIIGEKIWDKILARLSSIEILQNL